ncbi:MAG TPA: hypothetical protein P5534_17550 [Candidatus Paceibacterota bacterium]|nr:hypothetical protein [Candidatus Paceibacterota bacterium]
MQPTGGHMNHYWDAVKDFERQTEDLQSEIKSQVETVRGLADDIEAALAAGRNPADVVAQWRAYADAIEAFLASGGSFDALHECFDRLSEIANRADGA